MNHILQSKFPNSSGGLEISHGSAARSLPTANITFSADDGSNPIPQSQPTPTLKKETPTTPTSKSESKTQATLTGQKRSQKQAAELVTPSPKKGKTGGSNPFAKSQPTAATKSTKPVVNVFAIKS